jgi:hypothetical protein
MVLNRFPTDGVQSTVSTEDYVLLYNFYHFMQIKFRLIEDLHPALDSIERL